MSKFCVTCKWHCLRQPVVDGELSHMCDLVIVDLVTGEDRPLDLPAYDERSWKNQRPGGCGPDGKNWEAAP